MICTIASKGKLYRNTGNCHSNHYFSLVYAWPTLSQFWSFKIRRTTFLKLPKVCPFTDCEALKLQKGGSGDCRSFPFLESSLFKQLSLFLSDCFFFYPHFFPPNDIFFPFFFSVDWSHFFVHKIWGKFEIGLYLELTCPYLQDTSKIALGLCVSLNIPDRTFHN